MDFLVMFVRKRLNREWNFLQRYLIPEPVSGGLLVALLQELMWHYELQSI